MIRPDKKWALLQARRLPPSQFSLRQLLALGISLDEPRNEIFLELEEAHDLEIEAQALRIYSLHRQVHYQASPAESLRSWSEISDQKKDSYRLAIEQIIALSSSQGDDPDRVFDQMSDDLLLEIF